MVKDNRLQFNLQTILRAKLQRGRSFPAIPSISGENFGRRATCATDHLPRTARAFRQKKTSPAGSRPVQPSAKTQRDASTLGGRRDSLVPVAQEPLGGIRPPKCGWTQRRTPVFLTATMRRAEPDLRRSTIPQQKLLRIGEALQGSERHVGSRSPIPVA